MTRAATAPVVAAGLAAVLAWTALNSFSASHFLAASDPGIVAVDRDLAATALCLAAALGLASGRTRAPVATMLLLGIAYALSSANLADRLAVTDLGRFAMALAALYLCWPQLPAPVKVADDQ
jgi:hypothetical protein